MLITINGVSREVYEMMIKTKEYEDAVQKGCCVEYDEEYHEIMIGIFVGLSSEEQELISDALLDKFKKCVQIDM